MRVVPVQGCCSALSISDNPLLSRMSKKQFTISLYDAIKAYNLAYPMTPISGNPKKIVILVSNKWYPYKLWLHRMHTYLGNSGIAHVYCVKYRRGI